MNKKVRAAVVKRATETCECCFKFVGETGHLDHFFGRAKVKESIASCWLLCLKCDDDKTNNRPSAFVWLQRFAVHCSLYGYGPEAELAMTKIEVLRAKGLAA